MTKMAIAGMVLRGLWRVMTWSLLILGAVFVVWSEINRRVYSSK